MRSMRMAMAVAALSLAGCAANTNGGLTDAPSTTSSLAAPAPVASGGILSGGLGTALDERDRQRAYAAEIDALERGEPGLPTGWRGENPSRHGTVVPGAAYDAHGTRCRDYTHTIFIDGKPQTARATACRGADGRWAPLG